MKSFPKCNKCTSPDKCVFDTTTFAFANMPQGQNIPAALCGVMTHHVHNSVASAHSRRAV